MSFLILALPRSRTFWLSRYLTYGDWRCGHEELRHARNLNDIECWLKQPCTGTIETSAMPWWRLIPHFCAEMTVITIRRPVAEVLDSLARVGFTMTSAMVRNMAMLDHKLDQIEHRLPGVRSIQYNQLATEACVAEIFEHCLPYQHDPDWFRTMQPLNLQIDMVALLRYYAAYAEPMAKLAAQARHKTISLMRPHASIDDGMTIQQETFDDILRDGVELMREHCIDVGDPPDEYLRKNLPIIHELEKLGAVQWTTARCNGRLFGYLMALISPSLEYTDGKMAVHTFFYTSKDSKNLGLRLQRASIEALREQGVKEVVFRAGVRGSVAGRISTLYKRMGAIPHGELYKLDLT